jgi:CxxC motif-containing protein (DUF1111 family)
MLRRTIVASVTASVKCRQPPCDCVFLEAATLFLTFLLFVARSQAWSQADLYPHNAVTCDRCHNEPSEFGSSSMTVLRRGQLFRGIFISSAEGGIHHRNGERSPVFASGKEIRGERVSLSLLGDGYIEAIDGHDIAENSTMQRQEDDEVKGVTVNAPVLEAKSSHPAMQLGRFGWKSQHSSLMSSCADSLRNELGIRNRLYADEYPTHAMGDVPTPFDSPDSKTGRTELERLVDEIRHTDPPGRDQPLAASAKAQTGEKLFRQIGCAICHVPTYKTLPPGTGINGGTYTVPKFLGSKLIHPYSDFLLHDVGTGDGIPQAAKPEYLDQSTANKFRTSPLWGLRFRIGNLMHDGDTPNLEQAIGRHGGEASRVRDRYIRLSAEERRDLLTFLNSL